MPLLLPDIPDAEATPLVRQLLEIIRSQQERLQQLEDEILRLKGLKTRPIIAPSPLETPPTPPRAPGQKRPGSAKRLKTAQLTITDEVVVPLADRPPGSVFKGYEDFVVQDLIIRPRVIRYRRERWQAPDGQNLVAGLPAFAAITDHPGANDEILNHEVFVTFEDRSGWPVGQRDDDLVGNGQLGGLDPLR